MGHNAIRETKVGSGRIVVYAILLFQIILIGSLIRGIQVSYKSKERVEVLRDKKEQLEQEHAKLQRDAEYVQSDYYIEKVAREELQKSKPGEKVVILPESQRVTEQVVQQEVKAEKSLKNWEKWLELLIRWCGEYRGRTC